MKLRHLVAIALLLALASPSAFALRCGSNIVTQGAQDFQVRARCGLTQAAFAEKIEVPIETVRNWEQGKRNPRGPARALLKLIDRAPEAAFAALGKKRA